MFAFLLVEDELLISTFTFVDDVALLDVAIISNFLSITIGVPEDPPAGEAGFVSWIFRSSITSPFTTVFICTSTVETPLTISPDDAEFPPVFALEETWFSTMTVSAQALLAGRKIKDKRTKIFILCFCLPLFPLDEQPSPTGAVEGRSSKDPSKRRNPWACN